MDAFIETPRFPVDISYGSSGGPTFKTFIFEGDSGREGNVQAWDEVKGRWSVERAINDKTDFDVVRAMFYNTRGRGRGFRFKDWSDYQGVDEPVIGAVNGVNKVFRLQKRYVAGSFTFDRRIFKTVSGTVTAKFDASSAAILSFDHTTGTITTVNAPTIGQVVTASFEFDVPVRFDTDELAASYEGFQLQTWSSIPLVELILEG